MLNTNIDIMVPFPVCQGDMPVIPRVMLSNVEDHVDEKTLKDIASQMVDIIYTCCPAGYFRYMYEAIQTKLEH